MSASALKRIEQVIVVIMLLGIILMFQPWFSSIVELFEPFFPDARLGRAYRNDIAPIIVRYGFNAAFYGTVAFIVISHYSHKDIQKAVREKGGLMTLLLIVAPVIYGFGVLIHMAGAYYWSAILAVFNVVFAIAVWNKKLWGIIGLTVSVLIGLALAFTENGSMPTAIVFVVVALIINALFWPKRPKILDVTESS